MSNDDPKPTVYEAWSAVMSDVQAVRKTDRNEHFRFNFRGIDAVMTAVGPALRRHGVSVIPVNVVAEREHGGKMMETRLLVTYRVFGPAGDYFDGQAPGESADAGDKGTPKAMSVAYRTFLLQALTIPTDEPDPDQSTYQREAAPAGPSEQMVNHVGRWLKNRTGAATFEQASTLAAQAMTAGAADSADSLDAFLEAHVGGGDGE